MARKIKGLRGIDKVMRNLNREVRQIKTRSLGGLIEAAAFIRSDMDRKPPLIPVDTGHLRASWFVTSAMVLGDPFVRIGFTASYALAVHETFKQYKRPGSGAKFFESALLRNHETILNIIAKNARI